MQQIMFKTLLSLVLVVIVGVSTFGQSPRITGIGGYNAGDSVLNGRWTGQPTNAPRTASNKYNGYLAVDTWAWDNTSPSTWTITGTGFGTTKGSVFVDSPLLFGIMSISSWSNTQIKVNVAGSWQFAFARDVKIFVKTSNGATTYKTDNVVAVPKGRGYGQCTWEVFFRRKASNLAPPPTAYASTRVAINANYVPRIWDVLYWNTSHTAIITSTPQVIRSSDGRTTTYRFTLTERNAAWDEAMTTRTSEFTVRSGVVTQGILSNMSRTTVATSYWK